MRHRELSDYQPAPDLSRTGDRFYRLSATVELPRVAKMIALSAGWTSTLGACSPAIPWIEPCTSRSMWFGVRSSKWTLGVNPFAP